jgi:hypothetical protein
MGANAEGNSSLGTGVGTIDAASARIPRWPEGGQAESASLLDLESKVKLTTNDGMRLRVRRVENGKSIVQRARQPEMHPVSFAIPREQG